MDSLDYLTWQSRWILLEQPDDQNGKPMLYEYKVGPGLRLQTDGIEPYFACLKSKKGGMIPIRFTEERSLWRTGSPYSVSRSIKIVSFNHLQRFDGWPPYSDYLDNDVHHLTLKHTSQLPRFRRVT